MRCHVDRTGYDRYYIYVNEIEKRKKTKKNESEKKLIAKKSCVRIHTPAVAGQRMPVAQTFCSWLEILCGWRYSDGGDNDSDDMETCRHAVPTPEAFPCSLIVGRCLWLVLRLLARGFFLIGWNRSVHLGYDE